MIVFTVTATLGLEVLQLPRYQMACARFAPDDLIPADSLDVFK